MNKFVYRFKAAREVNGITVKELTSLTDASQSAMNGYSTGKRLPPLDVACMIAKELDVSLDWLCGIERNENGEREKKMSQLAELYEELMG